MRILPLSLIVLAAPLTALAAPRVEVSSRATPREQFAAEQLRSAVANLRGNERILLAVEHDPLFASYGKDVPELWPRCEGSLRAPVASTRHRNRRRRLRSFRRALRHRRAHRFRIHPSRLAPEATSTSKTIRELCIRGAVIDLQKPEITYEGAELSMTIRTRQKDFPRFYDKAEWTKYLDQLAEQRTNALFLWNGHPFTSLLKLPKYPEAQELPTAQLEQNIAMFRWITAEADKRGIWILQGFYNIHLSHAFARAHHVPLLPSAPRSFDEYTRYCISEFIRNYPNVGIFMTLGEAMGPHYGANWLSKTIIPGVLDGLAEEEKTVGHPVPQPPIVVRAHATDIDAAMAAARPLYSNIDTMWKWNGESLTWTNIRGSVRQKFQSMVSESNDTIVNIHLLSNLEPFRWGDPTFVRQTESNFVRLGIRGVHVYPLRYWDWPYSADKTEPLLIQPDRDWIWFATLGALCVESGA